MVTTPLDKLINVPKITINEAQESPFLDLAFQEHWTWVCRTLYQLAGDWDDAEDLALEVFYRLHQRPPRDQSNLGSWLHRVATNTGLNALRARQRRRKYEALAEKLGWQNSHAVNPEAEVERQETQHHVRHILAQMKSQRAQILILRHSGLSYADIATALNIAPGSVGTLLSRAEKDFERRYVKAFGQDSRFSEKGRGSQRQ